MAPVTETLLPEQPVLSPPTLSSSAVSEATERLLEELAQVQRRESYKLKFNNDYQSDKRLYEMKEMISVINGEMTPKSVARVCQAFGHSALDPELRLNCNTAANCILTDLGSGTGVTLLRMKLNMQPKYCYGIEVVEQRARDSQRMYEMLLDKSNALERDLLRGCTFLHSSFNDTQAHLVLLQTTHFFSFDCRFTDDSLTRMAQWLQENSSWKVLMSFRSLHTWNKCGLTHIKECYLNMNRSVNLSVSDDEFSFHLYVRQSDGSAPVGSKRLRSDTDSAESSKRKTRSKSKALKDR